MYISNEGSDGYDNRHYSIDRCSTTMINLNIEHGRKKIHVVVIEPLKHIERENLCPIKSRGIEFY